LVRPTSGHCRKLAEPFVFYEGPPTANGRPGLHHLISRTIKDLVCRHRTMQGRQVTRIAGWDTHGLPVEIEAERKLGISGKPEIEALGIEASTGPVASRSSPTRRSGSASRSASPTGSTTRPYVTFHTPYIESVWAILRKLADKGLLYRGHKSVPYCPRCGTALSSHEVAQGYAGGGGSFALLSVRLDRCRRSADPAGRSFLVWTTTPWTVPSNAALAVGEEMTYAQVPWTDPTPTGRTRHSSWWPRGESRPSLGRMPWWTGTYTGAELLGQRYARPLDLVAMTPAEAEGGWKVVGGELCFRR
jgi:isoleucyl-tRNA synthetase